jgi:hypothetical protein
VKLRSKDRATSGRSGKWVATLAAVLIVAAQSLALAHSHNSPDPSRFTPQTQTTAADAICGLCILAFHAPLNLAASPALERPRLETVASFFAETHSFAFGSHPFFLTRAPPSQA